MAEPTKLVRVFERVHDKIPHLADLMTQERGLEINQTEAASLAILEALARREQADAAREEEKKA
jgi:hypothetical protein